MPERSDKETVRTQIKQLGISYEDCWKYNQDDTDAIYRDSLAYIQDRTTKRKNFGTAKWPVTFIVMKRKSFIGKIVAYYRHAMIKVGKSYLDLTLEPFFLPSGEETRRVEVAITGEKAMHTSKDWHGPIDEVTRGETSFSPIETLHVSKNLFRLSH